VLSDAGYYLGYIGKWHLDWPTENDPANPGQYVDSKQTVVTALMNGMAMARLINIAIRTTTTPTGSVMNRASGRQNMKPTKRLSFLRVITSNDQSSPLLCLCR